MRATFAFFSLLVALGGCAAGTTADATFEDSLGEPVTPPELLDVSGHLDERLDAYGGIPEATIVPSTGGRRDSSTARFQFDGIAAYARVSITLDGLTELRVTMPNAVPAVLTRAGEEITGLNVYRTSRGGYVLRVMPLGPSVSRYARTEFLVTTVEAARALLSPDGNRPVAPARGQTIEVVAHDLDWAKASIGAPWGYSAVHISNARYGEDAVVTRIDSGKLSDDDVATRLEFGQGTLELRHGAGYVTTVDLRLPSDAGDCPDAKVVFHEQVDNARSDRQAGGPGVQVCRYTTPGIPRESTAMRFALSADTVVLDAIVRIATANDLARALHTHFVTK